ncbi:hypothetical protein [Bacillus velezensis]|nr:hypothetical protein [Bacillus velezensis]
MEKEGMRLEELKEKGDMGLRVKEVGWSDFEFLRGRGKFELVW